MNTTSPQDAATTPRLGVFDSGVGGLTVLRALLDHLPAAHFTYLGDTARLPYGSKSRDTVVRYAIGSARFLVDQGAQLLVIACNTASALALEEIREAVHPIPVLGVIEPGAQTATEPTTQTTTHIATEPATEPVLSLAASSAGISHDPPHPALAPADPPPPRVLVLATAATVHSGAYARALDARGVPSTEKSCPLLVPLVEEGWIDHPVTREVVRIYLAEALAAAPPFTTLLLGCTHYPLLRHIFAQALLKLNQPLTIVDSAQAVAAAVHRLIPAITTSAQNHSPHTTRCHFFATDSARRFRELGSRFLGQPILDVHHVDLGG